MDVFNVNNYYDDKHFPNFAKPEEIDSFSLFGEKREILHDKSCLKQYHYPKSALFKFDLNDGYDSYVESADDENRIDNLLRWILLTNDKNKHKNDNSSNNKLKQILRNADFVSWRGLLTKLAATPNEKKEGWIVCVTKYQDVYFLCEFETDVKKQQKLKMTHRDKLMTYWGHSFERFVAKPIPAEDSLSVPASVNFNDQFCSVVRTKLGDHRLLFGGEVDCLDVATGQYLELKTSRRIETDRQNVNFKRFKLLKWWLQSFLIGINRIICGFRDDDGFVEKIQEFTVKELPAIAGGQWSGAVCFNFLHDFLSCLTKNVTCNDAKRVYKFEFHPSSQKIQMIEVDPKDFEILRPWFLKQI